MSSLSCLPSFFFCFSLPVFAKASKEWTIPPRPRPGRKAAETAPKTGKRYELTLPSFSFLLEPPPLPILPSPQRFLLIEESGILIKTSIRMSFHHPVLKIVKLSVPSGRGSRITSLSLNKGVETVRASSLSPLPFFLSTSHLERVSDSCTIFPSLSISRSPFFAVLRRTGGSPKEHLSPNHLARPQSRVGRPQSRKPDPQVRQRSTKGSRRSTRRRFYRYSWKFCVREQYASRSNGEEEEEGQGRGV